MSSGEKPVLEPAGKAGNDADILKNTNMNAPTYEVQTASPSVPQSPPPAQGPRSLSSPRSRDRDTEEDRRKKGHRSTSGTSKLCVKCHQPLTGQFVRALGKTYHVDCFRCKDCNATVATKFFPIDDEEGNGQYPLCEKDYFRRLDLLCYECGGALRGSYITALDRKYHIEHFTCCVCPTVFGAQDSYYEHDGKVYCHYHYSTQFAQRCSGCQTSILKQFVEIFRAGQNQHWHPECYMIHKFWNVRLAPSEDQPVGLSKQDEDSEELRKQVREEEEKMEEKVYRIWSVLSTFEESSAACISDMLLHVSNGGYVDGVFVAKKFIMHVELLFSSLDGLDGMMTSSGLKPLAYGREAKLLCRKIVAFFALLQETQDTGVKKIGVTQELLSLVTGLAHYLKLLIRISLQGALKLERENGNSQGLDRFLTELNNPDAVPESAAILNNPAAVAELASSESDICPSCGEAVEDECAKYERKRWHLSCVSCTNCGRDFGRRVDDAQWVEVEKRILCRTCRGRNSNNQDAIQFVTKLEQYVFLLRVALARLLSMLRSSGSLPHTSDDPNLLPYDSSGGVRADTHLAPPKLGDEPRSKSYNGTPTNESSYENTLNDIRRLRSTRMERTLSSTTKKARQSRIIDGPEGSTARSGDGTDNYEEARSRGFQIVEDKDANGEAVTELAFGNNDTLTLDDIPRIVAAEQAKEQAPAFKGHEQPRSMPMERELDLSAGRGGAMGEPIQRAKKYFSELSALEYFIVRHVAVLSMEPLMEGQFNLDELLSLIETRKQTFWGMVGKAFKPDKNKGGKKKGVFGVALETLVEREGAESTFGVGPGALRIPAVIDDAVSAMSRMDMSVEGVFRKNGNIKRLKEIAETIDQRGSDAVDMTKESPVQVAALLKRFLRDMPDPVLTFKLHKLFIASQKIQNAEKRRRVLHLTCCLLPKAHRDTMEVLFTFLKWTSQFSQVDEDTGSKMDTRNLSTVITPNILYSNSKTPGIDDSFLAIEAVHTLIDCNEAMCMVPEDLQSVLNDPTLFNGSAEITTKEILKRYGDIGRQPPQQHYPVEQISEISNRTRPPAQRVDTDPSQQRAWQNESSVRHVQGQSAYLGPENAPSNAHWSFSAPNSPYHHRVGSSESQASNGGQKQKHQSRQLPWGKPHGQDQIGISGM